MDGERKDAELPQAALATPGERSAGAYSPCNLQRILSALHQDGLVILKGVVDTQHIDAVNQAMCEQAERSLADPNKVYNHNVRSNFLQRPPVNHSAYLHDDIYFNKFLLQVANAYLGHRPTWNWLTSNVALAKTSGIRQPVHKDNDFPHPQYPYYFIANIPLCDFNVVNGATEFWLGSHAATSVHEQSLATEADAESGRYKPGDRTCFIAADAREARRSVRPPVQPSVQRGDIVIRDIRLWHAGMPNESDEHRIMLGLGYQSPTHPNYRMRCHLPLSSQAFFLSHASNLVEVRANFYPDEELAKIKPDELFSLRPDQSD
ncbi:phytanoyl-dioxygenase family protein [Xylariaceae sp. AK1471]|nr:phytanoyl-dioxygenase family protein [Xylariaceae sp. AK1471]